MTETKEKVKKPKKRRLWLKIPLYTLIFIIVVVACLPFYSSLFIPTITGIIEKNTGRKASIDSLSVNLFAAHVYLENFQLKEDDEKTDFVKLEKIDLDLSVFSLLFQNIDIKKAEISGVHVAVSKDGKGGFNFQSILDKLPKSAPSDNSQQQENTSKENIAKPEPKPLESLPEISAKLILSDVNFKFNDYKSNTHFNMDKLNFTCNVAGLSKIGYHSNWDNAKFESKKGKESSAGLVYKLNGDAGIGLKNGNWAIFSKGDILFSDIYAKGFGEKDVTETSIKIEHDISLDLEKDLCEVKIVDIDSPYVNLKVSSIKIDKLKELQTKLSEIQTKINSLIKSDNFDEIKKLAQDFPMEGWGGSITSSIDFDRVKADFGDFIASKIPDSSGLQIEDFGGKIVFSAQFEGQKNLFKLTENLDIDKLYAKGTLKSGNKKFHVGLEKIKQTLLSNVDLDKEKVVINLDLDVHPQEKSTLLHFHSHNTINNIFKPSNFEIQNEEKILLDLDILSKTFQDFLPAETGLTGKIEENDWIKFVYGKGAEIKGNTTIFIKAKSPKAKNLPELSLKGERHIQADMDKNTIQQITIKKLDMETAKSNLFQLKGKGSVNLSGNSPGILVKLDVNLESLHKFITDLIPILEENKEKAKEDKNKNEEDKKDELFSFLRELALKGKIFHQTSLAKKGEKIRLEGNGGINSLLISFGPESVPFDVPKALWRYDLIASLQNNKPQNAQLKFSLEHPAININAMGQISDIQQEPLSFKFDKMKLKQGSKVKIVEGLEVEIDSDLSKIPFFVRKIAEENGVKLSRLEGRFNNNLNIKGSLDDLIVKNQLRFKGNIELALEEKIEASLEEKSEQAEKQKTPQKFYPPIKIQNGIESIIAISAKNVTKKNSMELAISPKSFFTVMQKNDKLLHIELGGKISKKPELDIQNLEVKTLVYGAAVQDSIPVDFIAKGNLELEEILTKGLKLDGNFAINLKVNGTPENIKLNINKDFSPFVIKYTDKQKGVILDKDKNFALSYQSNISYQQQEKSKTIIIANAKPKLGAANISMGDIKIVQSPENIDVTGLDGQSAVEVFAIKELSFSELNKMIPLIQSLKLENSTLDFRVENVLAHTKAKDFGGKLVCHVKVPEADLPHIQEKLGGDQKPKKITKTEVEDVKKVVDNKQEETKTTEEKKPITLSQEIRDMLRKLGVDVKIIVEKARIDKVNQASNLVVTASLNEEEANNQFLFDVDGKTNSGKLKITAQADLDKEHPKCTFKSDIDQVPYGISSFGSVSDRLNNMVQFPLFQKIDFGDPEKITFSLKGENSWTGLDPRIIKKSLFSAGETSFQISGGKFDLGFDMSKFIDTKAIEKELEKTVAPLKNTLNALQGKEGSSLNQISTAQNSLKSLEQNIEPVIKKKEDMESIIKETQSKLDLIGFGGALKKSIEKSKSALSSYDAQIEAYQKQKAELQNTLKGLQTKVGEFQNQITKLESDIKKQQESLMSKLKIDNPFSFNFGSIYIAFKVANDSPYQGENNKWSDHPFSRVDYVEISFSPKGKPYPAIKGSYSLDGGYTFNFLPSEEHMKNLREKAPFLADFINKENGIIWGSDGFKPSGNK